MTGYRGKNQRHAVNGFYMFGLSFGVGIGIGFGIGFGIECLPQLMWQESPAGGVPLLKGI
jgi:hypothetical protein